MKKTLIRSLLKILISRLSITENLFLYNIIMFNIHDKDPKGTWDTQLSNKIHFSIYIFKQNKKAPIIKNIPKPWLSHILFHQL